MNEFHINFNILHYSFYTLSFAYSIPDGVQVEIQNFRFPSFLEHCSGIHPGGDVEM